MIVYIYRDCGHLDRTLMCKKFFYTFAKAENFCKFIAPKIYGAGNYSFTIINR